jgi:hypothetical protein
MSAAWGDELMDSTGDPDDFTSDELDDAGRDLAALLRASQEGDHAAVIGHLRAMDERQLRALARIYTAAFTSLHRRFALAYGLLPVDEHRTLVTTIDEDLLTSDEEMNAFVLDNITRIQASIIAGE